MATEVAARRRVGEPGGFLRRTFESRLKRSPYGMLGCAMGVGFVLGGGLFTRLSARLVGVGLRVALRSALPLLERQIVRVVTRSRLNNNEKENRA